MNVEQVKKIWTQPLELSSGTDANSSPNLSTNLFQCFEVGLSDNSPTIFSMMDSNEIETITFGTSLLDKFREKGIVAHAEPSQKGWYVSCVPERV